MGDKTHIGWTSATWNPVTGCTRISDGCDRCYIDRTPPFRMQGRKFLPLGVTTGATTGVQLHHDRLDQPLRWRKPRRIFVNSLSDLFHDDVPDSYIGAVFDIMAKAERHTFQILTKRHARMRSLLSKWVEQSDQPGTAMFRAHGGVWAGPIPWPLPNVWLGVSIENQQWADIRIPALLDTPAAVRFLSCEPLLGPVDLHRYLWLTGNSTAGPFRDHAGRPRGGGGVGGQMITSVPARDFHWVIVGGESGPGARPMHPDWARGLRDQCTAAGVPWFFKQHGEWWPVPDGQSRGADHWIRSDGSHWEIAENQPAHDGTERVVRRVGKRLAGNVLDGRVWEEFPDA